ncbi:MAG TPA: adenylate/guanylate cyclase domain-containing protein [Thermohalobaculum sp.]|nr:adenylate/guanylate cyclase domain-containing protein [Thermohalobaculum sp.]
MPYPVPANEAERNAAVRSYRIMDTPPEIAFDEISDLAARICGCPVAYVSFIENDRQSFKSKYGLPDDFESCPREISFCQVSVCGADILLAPDLATDERFREFHFVVNEPHFRFYASMPLINAEGYALGTICVMDFEPRELSFEQQETLRRLAHQVVGLLEHRRRMIELGEAMQGLDEAHAALAEEKARSEELLARILPEPVAAEIKARGKVQPRFFPSATVLLADIKGFTAFTRQAEPASLIELLDRYFARFDDVMEHWGLEKLKTVGDAYLAVAGAPEPDRQHVLNACLAALEMQGTVAALGVERAKLHLPAFELRIGLHTGPLIAGVVGRRRFTYDVWGDAVNIAKVMEARGEPGRINVSDAVRQHVAAHFEFTAREPAPAKYGGELAMHFLDRLKPEFAQDAGGQEPNGRMLAAAGRASGGAGGDWHRNLPGA